jgi:hypothetical protein
MSNWERIQFSSVIEKCNLSHDKKRQLVAAPKLIYFLFLT